MRKGYIAILITLFITIIPLLSIAQAVIPAAPMDTPIDGGLSLLLAAGVGYGVKKYREQRKK